MNISHTRDNLYELRPLFAFYSATRRVAKRNWNKQVEEVKARETDVKGKSDYAAQIVKNVRAIKYAVRVDVLLSTILCHPMNPKREREKN